MKFIDNAAPILKGDPILSDQNRADLWDLFHVHSKDAAELAAHLTDVAIPSDTKAQLLAAKNKPATELALHEKVLGAMSKMDPKALDIAEKHPKLLQLFLDSADEE